jgi:hypothetical protein
MNQRIRVLQVLGADLQSAVERAPAAAVPRRRVVLVAAVLLALALAAVTLAATGVLGTGVPVRLGGFGDLTRPHSGAGAVVPRSVQGIVAQADDPVEGPPWGMRVLRTTRGLGCVQIGRVVNGRLGVIGRDGAFGNDGRFHPLPPQVIENPVDCAALDARGRLYIAFESQGVVASAYAFGCTPPGDIEAHPNPPLCSQADERAIYGGLLGPAALRITYASPGGGGSASVPVGVGGAYLIVAPADPKLDLGGANTSGVLPSPGNGQPIESISYRGGLVCHISDLAETADHGRPCAAPGRVRLTPRAPLLQQVASPVHFVRRTDVRIDGHPSDDLSIAFVARVAATGADSAYTLQLRVPDTGSCHGETVGTATDQDIARGEIVHLHYTGAASAGSFLRCRGRTIGTVYYAQTSSPQGPPIVLAPRPGVSAVPVGHFSFQVK